MHSSFMLERETGFRLRRLGKKGENYSFDSGSGELCSCCRDSVGAEVRNCDAL